VTERQPGLQPRGKDFPRRNRIIAGLAHGVVIVEAAMRSGTLVTARYANDHGREVFALPGHPLDPRAAGTNGLIKQGAMLVTEPAEVLEVLQPIVGRKHRPAAHDGSGGATHFDTHRDNSIQAGPIIKSAPPQQPSSRDAADVMRAVLTALGPAPTGVDAITRATGLDVQSVQIALLELDLAGRIERQGLSLVALKGAS
jgi:DNA processing protein